MTRRSKSNLVVPRTGPGSAACYCRRMERKAIVEETRQRQRAERESSPSNGARFADFTIDSVASLEEFYEAVREKVQMGAGYRVRVAMI